jgi:large subunit ribosomal protein L1
MTRSKRYTAVVAKLDKAKIYSIAEAINILKEDKLKFDSTIEVHLRLGIDPKKGDQIVRGVVQLPHGTGKTKKVIAFVTPDQENDAKSAGADIIGNDEVIQKIKQTSKIDFEVAVATPAMMKKIAPIAKILGQKGLMPNPKTETIGPDIKKIVAGVKAGKATFKNDDSGNIHALVGKLSFAEDKLVENVKSLIQAVKKVKPATSKGTYIKNAVICTTMGPSLKINTNL